MTLLKPIRYIFSLSHSSLFSIIIIGSTVLVQCVTFVIKICRICWYIFYYLLSHFMLSYFTLTPIWNIARFRIVVDLVSFFCHLFIYLFYYFLTAWLPDAEDFVYNKEIKLVFIVLTNLAFLRLGSPERRARGREHSKVNWKGESIENIYGADAWPSEPPFQKTVCIRTGCSRENTAHYSKFWLIGC